MEARLLRAALFVAAILSLGAGRPYHSVRSQHFIVSAPTPQLAEEICKAAEQYRRDLAIEWLGHELPEWQGPCPIRADVAPSLGAGGATSFIFHGGMPSGWTMQIQGSRERVLDSVLPHEITHTIFATHFGGPLPRWADEGACTMVEHESEKAKQDRFLIQFLMSDKGIPFNRMFQMKEYPPDILPLYSQGYSLARFLIQQGGKQKFVEYVGEGMRRRNGTDTTRIWTDATRNHYGFNSLSDLQVTWVEWVRRGSPAFSDGKLPDSLLAASGVTRAGSVDPRVVSNTQMASLLQQPRSRIPEGALSSWQTVQAQNARALAQGERYETQPQPANSARPAVTGADNSTPDYTSSSRPPSDGWYAKRRDQAQAVLGSHAGRDAAASEIPPEPPQSIEKTAEQNASPGRTVIQAEPVSPLKTSANQPSSRVLMEWTRPADQPYRPAADMTGIATNDRSTLLR
jgi:hypothetical protein